MNTEDLKVQKIINILNRFTAIILVLILIKLFLF